MSAKRSFEAERSRTFSRRWVVQPNLSRGLDATFHFKFIGGEEREATITIRDRTIDIKDGLVGNADVRVTADSKNWLAYLAKEESLPLALIRILDRRREMVEHPFGSIKQWIRAPFLMKGLDNVRAEFSLTARRALKILGVEAMMAAARG